MCAVTSKYRTNSAKDNEHSLKKICIFALQIMKNPKIHKGHGGVCMVWYHIYCLKAINAHNNKMSFYNIGNSMFQQQYIGIVNRQLKGIFSVLAAHTVNKYGLSWVIVGLLGDGANSVDQSQCCSNQGCGCGGIVQPLLHNLLLCFNSFIEYSWVNLLFESEGYGHIHNKYNPGDTYGGQCENVVWHAPMEKKLGNV